MKINDKVKTEHGDGVIIGIDGYYGLLEFPEARFVVKLCDMKKEHLDLYPDSKMCFFEHELESLS